MDDIDARIELRNRVMRREFLALSMEQRVERSDRHQFGWWHTLSLDAGIFDRFYRRNLARRAVGANHVQVPRH